MSKGIGRIYSSCEHRGDVLVKNNDGTIAKISDILYVVNFIDPPIYELPEVWGTSIETLDQCRHSVASVERECSEPSVRPRPE